MIHLGSIGRISIDVDASFLILIVFFVATFYDPDQGIRYALLWAPVLFISVLLHELAHAGAIALFGYGGSQIVLGGMGGVTVSQRRGKPWHDMLISLAGPVASFVVAYLTTTVRRHMPYAMTDPMLLAFLPILRTANFWWGIFNLIPVSPLDGGHVVRHFFRIFLRERTAFVVAVWVGMIVGALVAVAGVFMRSIFLSLLMAWYVFINYQQWQYFRKHGYPGD
jgi:stage IV sporulation protein FB